MKKFTLSIIATLITLLSENILAETNLSGHNKFSNFILELNDESTSGIINQTRINFKYNASKNLTINLESEASILFLSNSKFGPIQNMIKEDYRLFDLPELESNKKKDQNLFLLLNLDRLNLIKNFSFLDISLGRQALSYGVSNFISPTNIFSRQNNLALDSEYSEGIDAIKLMIPLKETSELEVTHIFTKKNDLSLNPYLIRLKFPLSIISTELTGIYYFKNVLLGLSQQWPIGSIEVLSELAYTSGKNNESYLRGSWGLQHYFSSGILTTLEYHYNSCGSIKEIEDKYKFAYTEGGVYLRRKHYISFGAQKTFDDLTSLFMSSLINVQDKSFQLSSSLEYTKIENLYLQITLSYLFNKETGTEILGPNVLMFSLKKYY